MHFTRIRVPIYIIIITLDFMLNLQLNIIIT